MQTNSQFVLHGRVSRRLSYTLSVQGTKLHPPRNLSQKQTLASRVGSCEPECHVSQSENRLKDSASPYLRSAAHQPIDWYEWNESAFARAKTEDKPILLDIGAVWCHWCHVMDGESYEDARVADLLNADFVCIKVDRDERPDVDARYQRAVQARTVS